jgi:multicomponent Na+:H+ antiporter subunit F
VTALHWVAGGILAVSAMLAVIRMVAGPTILDRMIASDVLLTTLLLVVGAEMVINHHTRTIPIMLVLAGTAAFATIAVARYVSKQDRSTGEDR